MDKIKAILPTFLMRFVMMSLILNLINYLQGSKFGWYYPFILAFGMAAIASLYDSSKQN